MSWVGVNPVQMFKVGCALYSAAVTVYSAPDDGRKGRPKHVQHTRSC